MPKVSVLIPTYNYAHYLDETILSVLQQTYSDFELIIVDNNSTDNTKEIVEKYLTDNRVSFYVNEKNLGLVGNWNKCLEYANGEYIKYLCADDKFHPEILSIFVPIMDQNKSLAIISCQKQWFGTDIKPKKIGVPFSGFKSGKEAIFDLLKYDNYLGEPSLPMIRKSLIASEKFNDKFKFIIDWEMWTRILSKGDCYIVPKVLCYTRKHYQRQTVYIHSGLYKQQEEYELFKSFQTGNRSIEFKEQGAEIRTLVKKKAIVCSKEMYKLVPKLHMSLGRNLFFKMFNIAKNENVIFSSVLKIHYNKKVTSILKNEKEDPLLKI